MLKAGELDLALGFDSRIRPLVDGIAREHLLTDPMHVVMPVDHPLVRKRPIRLADFADDPWVAGTYDCECNRLITRACAVAGFEPRIAFQTDDYTAMQGFVAAGVGVSLIAELGLSSVRDDIVVRSLGRDTPVREVFAATSADAYRTPATEAMLEILGEVAGRYERRPQLQLVS
jgi:DNA-binding transcriptional LysR family regulator